MFCFEQDVKRLIGSYVIYITCINCRRPLKQQDCKGLQNWRTEDEVVLGLSNALLWIDAGKSRKSLTRIIVGHWLQSKPCVSRDWVLRLLSHSSRQFVAPSSWVQNCTSCVLFVLQVGWVRLWDLRLGAVKFYLIMKFKIDPECFPKMSVMISGGKFRSGGGNYKNGQSFLRLMLPDFRAKLGLTPAVL